MPEAEVSVILPCLNERGDIGPLIRRLLELLPAPREIIVVDDDSPDGTAEAVRREFAGCPDVRLAVRAGRRGLVGALREGLALSRAEIAAWMDADLSMPPETLAALAAAVRSGSCDAAIGSRFAAGGGDRRLRCGRPTLVLQALLSLCISRASERLLGRGCSDWTSGFIAIRRDALRRFPLRGDHGEYFIRLVFSLLRAGCRVRELPYQFELRQNGESKTAGSPWGLLRRGPKYVATVIGCMLSGRDGA